MRRATGSGPKRSDQCSCRPARQRTSPESTLIGPSSSKTRQTTRNALLPFDLGKVLAREISMTGRGVGPAAFNGRSLQSWLLATVSLDSRRVHSEARTTSCAARGPPTWQASRRIVLISEAIINAKIQALQVNTNLTLALFHFPKIGVSELGNASPVLG